MRFGLFQWRVVKKSDYYCLLHDDRDRLVIELSCLGNGQWQSHLQTMDQHRHPLHQPVIEACWFSTGDSLSVTPLSAITDTIVNHWERFISIRFPEMYLERVAAQI